MTDLAEQPVNRLASWAGIESYIEAWYYSVSGRAKASQDGQDSPNAKSGTSEDGQA